MSCFFYAFLLVLLCIVIFLKRMENVVRKIGLSVKRIISLALISAFVLACCVTPIVSTAAEVSDLSEGKLFDFDNNNVLMGSNQLIDGSTVNTSDASTLELQTEMRVAGWGWSLADDGTGNKVLKAGKKDNTAYQTAGALRLNDNNEFCILKPAQSYYVSVRYKVVSTHVLFTSGGNTYPSESATSTFTIGYDSRVGNDVNSGARMPNIRTVLATPVKANNTQGTFFSTDEFGIETTKNTGEWYTEEIYFTTPAVFESYSQHFAIATSFYNGFQIYIDDIYIKETPTIDLHLNGGSGEVKKPALVGAEIEIPEPVREGYTFAGWYRDEALSVAFTDTVFTNDNCNISLYAKWQADHNIYTADFYNYEKVTLNSSTYTESNFSIISNGSKEGNKKLNFDGRKAISTTNRAFFPLANDSGNITLKSNTTYAVMVDYTMQCEMAGSQYKLRVLSAAADNINDTPVIHYDELVPSGDYRHYITFTTGEIASGKTAAYIEISSKNSNVINVGFNKIKVIQIDDGMSYLRAYDTFSYVTYEYLGYTGDTVDLPVFTSSGAFVFDGWYTSQNFEKKHSGVLGSEKLDFAYSFWSNKPEDFENFVPILADSYTTVGKDIEIVRDANSYAGAKMLKYTYNYVPNYFAGESNAISLAKVYDKTTYKVTFKYKLDKSLDDVQLKFFTAHRSNRWCYITNYNEATYTVYSAETGKGWKEATVYLTTNFVKAEHSDGLFMSFNPVVEGETVVCIDDFTLEAVKADEGVVAFLGKDDKAYAYERAAVGTNVKVISTQPSEYFSAFEGWYTDKECTVPFKSTAVTKGITYVYSKWTENAENFEGYLYSNRRVVTESGNKVLKSGSAILGKAEDNSTYLVTYKYKTSDASASVYFETAPETYESAFAVKYTEEGSILKGKEVIADNAWHTVKRYISTSFFNEQSNMLYAVASGDIAIDDIVFKKIEVLLEKGTSALTSENEQAADSQALRFYYSYESDNGATVTVDGEELTLVERGIVLKNAAADEGALTVTNAENAKKGYAIKNKTHGFGSYWNYDSENEAVVYSYYLTDLYKDDTRDIYARGYIKVKDEDGTVYTIYSSKNNTTVKAVKAVAAEITDKKVHTINGKNWNRFTIVNPKVMPYIYGREIENLIDYAVAKGVTLTRVNEKVAETPYEIVIGDTVRDTSSLVSVKNDNEYVIAVKGNKVIIKGGSDIATAQGVADFIAYLEYKDSLSCGADLYDGFELRGEYAPASDNYVLTFNEDFNTLDLNKWGSYAGYDYGYYYGESILGGSYGNRSVNGNAVLTKSGETKKLVRVEDGNLVLGSAWVTPTEPKDIEMNVEFMHANLSTFYTMLYKYGMLEIRSDVADVPSATSFWINDASGNGFGQHQGCMTEYDLIENYGRTNYYASAIHHWSNNLTTNNLDHFGPPAENYTGNMEQVYKPDFDESSIYDNYHIYTFLWEEDKIVFAFDGVKYAEYEVVDWYRENMANCIILSSGLGDACYGAVFEPNRHTDYYETLIDYIKIYQVEDMGSTMIWLK